MEFNGLFGKVVAELIAEGQADPSILKELYVRHVGLRRAFTIALIKRGKAAGEFLRRHRCRTACRCKRCTGLLQLLVRFEPLTEKYPNALIDQVLL